MREPFEESREDFAVGERFDRESTEEEALEAIEIGAEEECRECFHPAHEGICGVERGDRPGDGEHCAVAYPPCPCEFSERRAQLVEAIQAEEREDIVRAARAFNEGLSMLFTALKGNGVL